MATFILQGPSGSSTDSQRIAARLPKDAKYSAGESTMRVVTKWAMGLMAAGELSLGACGSADVEGPGALQAGLVDDAPEAVHLGLVREAIGKVSLRADQKPLVEQLGREAEMRHEPIRKARADLGGALADQVAAGKGDRAPLKPAPDALLAAVEQSRGPDP